MFFVAEFINPICLPPPEFEEKDFVGYVPLVAGWERPEVNRRTLVGIIIFVRLFPDFAKIKSLKICFLQILNKINEWPHISIHILSYKY